MAGLIRFKTARHYDVGTIRETVVAHLPKGACTVRPGDTPAPVHKGKPPGWVWKRVAA